MSDTHADTIRARNIAEAVLADRREGEVCNAHECFYPTVLILAGATITLGAESEIPEGVEPEAWARSNRIIRDKAAQCERERERADQAEAALIEMYAEREYLYECARIRRKPRWDELDAETKDLWLEDAALSAGSGGRETT